MNKQIKEEKGKLMEEQRKKEYIDKLEKLYQVVVEAKDYSTALSILGEQYRIKSSSKRKRLK